MPRKEFIDLIKEIKKTGQSKQMSKRNFIWKFDYYEKRTSGNIWRINEYLNKNKMTVEPNYQHGWIDESITLKEKDKIKIKNGNKESYTEEIDPITRLSILEAASRKIISVSRDSSLEEAYYLMWQNGFSQLPVMNNDREVLGIISWKSIAKGLISKKESKQVQHFMTDEFTILDENTPLFDAIKQVIESGTVFVSNHEKKIKGPVTTSDLNDQFLEQIEPYILLEQIENFIRQILHDKIILEDITKLLDKKDEDKREILSISDMNFGEYIRIFENIEMWNLLELPFSRTEFVKNLDDIRIIRNGVMHFHPDKISKTELKALRKTSVFLMDFLKY